MGALYLYSSYEVETSSTRISVFRTAAERMLKSPGASPQATTAPPSFKRLRRVIPFIADPLNLSCRNDRDAVFRGDAFDTLKIARNLFQENRELGFKTLVAANPAVRRRAEQ